LDLVHNRDAIYVIAEVDDGEEHYLLELAERFSCHAAPSICIGLIE
jgi:hypothetical protein